MEKFDHASLSAIAYYDDSFDSQKFIKMRLRICHDGDNPNGSHFELDDMQKAQDSLVNIPILANVVFDDDGNPQFGGHDMDIERNKLNDKEFRFVYKEVPIGVIPEDCNAQIEEYDGRNYVCADGYIWRDYCNYAEDIIERDKDIKISMEIAIKDSSYDEENKVFNITDYSYRGVTFLGNKYGTGMIDACATTNFTDNQQRMLMIMEELKETLEQFSKRGETEMNDETNVVVGAVSENEIVDGEVVDKEFTKDAPVDNAGAENFDNKDTADGSCTLTVEEAPSPDYAIQTFKLSHDDIRCLLADELWKSYSLDDAFPWICKVYDDMFEYTVEYNDTSLADKCFRQKYTKTDDAVEFVGEPVEIFIRALTKEELDALETLNSDYAAVKSENEKLAAEVTELREFKSSVINEQHTAEISAVIDKWSQILSGNEEFEALRQADFATMDVADVEIKCKVIYADQTAVFTVKKTEKEPVVKFSLNTESEDDTDKPYGGIVEKYLR